jgi:catechol-2,3-dioxygenase
MAPSPLASEGVEVALVLAADDPVALAAFYAALVDVEPMPGFSATHWRVALPGAGWLELYRPSRARPQPPQRGRLAVCLRRRGHASALEQWLHQAISLGAQQLDTPRAEAFGSEVWLLDPEGNGLLLLVSDS